MVKEVSKETANSIIRESKLQQVYSDINGKIFSTNEFKTLLNNNSKFRYDVFKELNNS